MRFDKTSRQKQWPEKKLPSRSCPKKNRPENFLNDLSNSGPAVRRKSDGRATGPPWRTDMSFLRDLKIAARSLSRVPALWITVALTLALGIGANAAIFSVVRAVLLRPLANRDEDRLLYIRQSAPGIGVTNATFSIPEIQDL